MTFPSKATIVLGLLAASSTCAMADTIWNLNDIDFDNGNQATGYFITNDADTAIDGFSIQVTGPATEADFIATQMVNAYLPTEIGIADAGFVQYVDLYVASALTNAGGTIDITSGVDCNGCGTLLVDSTHTPNVSGTAYTPEPSTLPFLGCGAILMGVAIHKLFSRTTR
jgi:hypothetical protein